MPKYSNILAKIKCLVDLATLLAGFELSRLEVTMFQ
jgi:hypothetical protein